MSVPERVRSGLRPGGVVEVAQPPSGPFWIGQVVSTNPLTVDVAGVGVRRVGSWNPTIGPVQNANWLVLVRLGVEWFALCRRFEL